MFPFFFYDPASWHRINNTFKQQRFVPVSPFKVYRSCTFKVWVFSSVDVSSISYELNGDHTRLYSESKEAYKEIHFPILFFSGCRSKQTRVIGKIFTGGEKRRLPRRHINQL